MKKIFLYLPEHLSKQAEKKHKRQENESGNGGHDFVLLL